MDKKLRRYKVNYAVAYRHYVDFGGVRTLEKFCQDEGYDFEKFKRYGRDAFWQHLIYGRTASTGPHTDSPNEG